MPRIDPQNLPASYVLGVLGTIFYVFAALFVGALSRFWGAVMLAALLVGGVIWWKTRSREDKAREVEALVEAERKIEGLPLVGPVIWLFRRVDLILTAILLLFFAYWLATTLWQGP